MNVRRTSRLEYNLPLARYTRWRVGGTADIAFFPANTDELAAFLRELPCEVPLTVLGLGSNVLIRDGGIRGAVVILHDTSAEPQRQGESIYAPAALAAPKLARYAAQQGCADAAFFAGIPGTVGGALAMNAGCYGDETWRHVVRVAVVQRNGVLLERSPEEYRIAYREVALKDAPSMPEWFVGAWFRFAPGTTEAALNEIKTLLKKRAAAQPLSLPNAGSVFRNPEGDYAGRLIESCGLKGFVLGGARVSEKHANFIVNPESRASAADIEALISYVQEQVKQKTNITLLPEVKMIGERR